jgi:Tfp pilus assembly protein PilX
MSHTQPPGERGFALVLVMFFVLIISGLSIGLLQEGAAARISLNNHKSNLHALEIAETGLVRAEMELRSGVDLDGNGVGFATGTAANGTYLVSAVADPVLPNRWTLHATGTFAQSTRRLEVGVRRREASYYVDALFSEEDLPLSNVESDAYDSRLGTYASQAVNTDARGTYAQEGGGVGGNANIELDGSTVWVRGNAIPGPDGAIVAAGDPTVTGDMAPRNFIVEMPPPPFAEFEVAAETNDNGTFNGGGNGNKIRYNNANGTLTVTGNSTVDFPGGTYFFTQFTVLGGSTINFTGPVKIYVTESIDVGAGSHLLAARPSDVEIIVHPYDMSNQASSGGDAFIKINGGSSITWALYAPGATLDVGGGNQFFGAAIGKQIELQGGNYFHYDKALGEALVRGVADLERLYWREAAPPNR